MESIKLGIVTSQMFGENAYFAWRDGQTECLVVDPGLDVDQILQFMEQQSLQPAVILNTHGHADHIAGNAGLKERYPEIPLVIGDTPGHSVGHVVFVVEENDPVLVFGGDVLFRGGIGRTDLSRRGL